MCILILIYYRERGLKRVLRYHRLKKNVYIVYKGIMYAFAICADQMLKASRRIWFIKRNVDIPDYNIPDYNISDYNIPDYDILDYNISDYNIPDYNIPDYDIPDYDKKS